MDDRIHRVFIPHLRSQFERGLPVLVTGAGFSLGAKNILGTDLPSVAQLKNKLWELCFPGESFEEGTSLQDIYETALHRHKNSARELLTQWLSVDSASIPQWYEKIFSFPWVRCYTLNVDDLSVAISRKFDLPRLVRQISATSPELTSPSLGTSNLNVIHLNGTTSDIPDHITFSRTQYAQRLAKPEAWYVRLVADMVTRPIVYVGTSLDEPPLWQHLELRGSRGARGLSELRPRSYLVTPKIERARLALLANFNVEWISMTAEEFAQTVLDACGDAKRAGLEELGQQRTEGFTEARIPEVSSLARNPLQETDYLIGEEPTWADLQSGRAVHRDFDHDLADTVDRFSGSKKVRRPILITGTAGSGKTTSLMRTCLRLTASGKRVGWIDRNVDIRPGAIRSAMIEPEGLEAVAIDDADLYGAELASIVREIHLSEQCPLILVTVRSGRVDRVLNPARMEGAEVTEFVMPHLTDSDIGGLVETLTRENRMGILTGKPKQQQEEAFRQQAGRQLFVAMYQATSGKRFEERAATELAELESGAARMYAIICLATAFRYDLGREDVLIAIGERSNESLNLLDQLIRRHLIVSSPNGTVAARHRVTAELVRDHLLETGKISEILRGLALAVATKVTPDLRRNAKPWRLLSYLLNHDFLLRAVGSEEARNLYGELENVLSWDSHFWLQRGSLEVDLRTLNRAEHFLSQAQALAPDDALVETEQAYLIFCKAIENPRAVEAPDRVMKATETLADLIRRRGSVDHYPYHVLGSQALAWGRRGIPNRDDKAKYLKRILGLVEGGKEKHPRSRELQQLSLDLKTELLSVAVT